MARITSLTADRILQIEQEHINSGSVNGRSIRLQRRNGNEISIGTVEDCYRSGWRDVSSFLASGWSGTLFINRSCHMVTIRGKISSDNATAGHIYTFHNGYRPDTLSGPGGFEYGGTLMWPENNAPDPRRASYYNNRLTIWGYSVPESYIINTVFYTGDSPATIEPGNPA